VNELVYISVLSGLLFSCITWYVTSRYYCWRAQDEHHRHIADYEYRLTLQQRGHTLACRFPNRCCCEGLRR
jgi:hypothetical protein